MKLELGFCQRQADGRDIAELLPRRCSKLDPMGRTDIASLSQIVTRSTCSPIAGC
jgi:hypothetical protein